MSSTALETAGEVYQDFERMVDVTVYEFHSKHGGDLEEQRSIANSIFVRAYNTHKPEKGKFSTWLTFLINKILLEHYRRGKMRQARIPRVSIEFENYSKRQPHRPFIEFLDGLSEDAREVVDMVIETPIELRFALLDREHNSPYHSRLAIMECLREMGWDKLRIRETFNEIAKALSS